MRNTFHIYCDCEECATRDEKAKKLDFLLERDTTGYLESLLEEIKNEF